MRTLYVMLVVMLCIVPLSLSQEALKPEAKLVKRIEDGCGTDCTRELAIDVGGIYAKLGDTIAIRVCSKKPFPVAISIAAAPPEPLIRVLEGSYQYPRERILLLRSEDCLGTQDNVSATEYWAIPKGAGLPPYRELFTSAQLKINDLEAKSSIGDAISYKSSLNKLPKILKENPESVGVILGYYYRKPSYKLKNRLETVTKLLRRRGVTKNQYFAILTPWLGEREVSAPEPQYPVLFSIYIQGWH
jgi:hypothetical protein